MSKMDSNCSETASNAGSASEVGGVLTTADFAPFFQDVYGHEPFPWQQRLTEQVLNQGTWPKVIDLPTGTGKTAVLDTAVFAMVACPATSPRRVVFVIDRRIVVDQVYEKARRLQNRISSGQTSILKLVRERLRKLSDAEQPLGVVALRGGVPIDNEWAHRPDQPWIMVSTVDQFGSRLLFRGYGVSPSMRPIHAGLAGNDCLVLLDEVHLSVPFAETLTQVAVLKSRRLPRRFGVVEMSATPSDKEAERFTLDPIADLEECEELRRRVVADKKAELVTIQNHDAMPMAVLKIINSISRLKRDEDIRSVGVVVNRVRTARETHQALAEAGYSTHLITGRMRPLDRVDALDNIGPAIDPDGEQHSGELTVVVATQAIEVGADFSFNALITECAAIDSLRQRFGRLDRRGTHFARTGHAARAWIIGPKSVVNSQKPDPIYGDSAKATWKELQRRSANDKESPINVGSLSLQDFPDNAAAPKTSAPLLLRTHLEAWSQTNPEPIVQPPVEWFLHGIHQNSTADVAILWRWDRSPDVLRLVPPRQAEFLQIPIDAARSWLSAGLEVDVADVTHQSGTAWNGDFKADGASADWVRWEGFGKDPGHISVSEIRPGDILVVDPSRGGLKTGTWNPFSAESVEDLGDAAQIAYGRRATLRLDSRLFNIVSPPLPAADDAPASIRISQWLTQCSIDPDAGPSWFSKAIEILMSSSFEITQVGIDDEVSNPGYYLLTERNSKTKKPKVDAAIMDGSDESCSLTGTGVTLRSHLEGVGDRARLIAERLGLEYEFVEDLSLAGQLHDIGKVDRRFQAQLVGGDPVDMEMLKEPLAKSFPGVPQIRQYPTGMRHEMASVALVESNLGVLSTAHDKDLVLHLVGTHHGWGRPLPPISEDPNPQTLTFTFGSHSLKTDSNLVESPLALDMADRFWRLVELYGYYGLAWLEAILRLADHQQSAEEAARS